MQQLVIEAESREIANKQKLKTLKKEGKIPAVLYGGKEKSVALSVDAKKFEKMLQTEKSSAMLVNLKIGAESKTAIIKDIQRDIISQRPIHIDFQAISLTDTIEVGVHLHIQGEAPGVKLGGGILEHIIRDVRVKCLPTDIPKVINVDVSKLEIGHALYVKDLPKIAGVEILNDPETIIVNIVAPTELEEVAPAVEGAVAAATSAEPEVIKKGKKDEEGAEAAPAEGDKGAKKPEAAKAGAPAADQKKTEPKK
jgi:large subunit ribosomal protein L25